MTDRREDEERLRKGYKAINRTLKEESGKSIVSLAAVRELTDGLKKCKALAKKFNIKLENNDGPS